MPEGPTGSGGSSDHPPANGNGNGAGQAHGVGNGRLHRLLRYSHIFSSAVREILEVKYLEQVTALPLTLPQFHLLKLIALNGKHQVGEVAEFLGVSSPAASKNIDKLVRLGLVERGADEGDRRVTLLSASAKGRRLIQSYEKLKKERLTPVLERFEPEEIDQFAHLLERFSVLLFEQEKADRDYCLRCAAYAQEKCPVGHVQGNCPYDRIRKRNLLVEEGGGDLR